MSAAERAAVLEEARSWAGTPFHHNAAVKGAGCDCGSLMSAVFVGRSPIKDLPLGVYSSQWWVHFENEIIVNGMLERGFREITKEEIQPADVAVVKIARNYAHSCIISEWPKVLHMNPVTSSLSENNILTFPLLSMRPTRYFSAWGA